MNFGVSLGLSSDRAYGDWREMLAGELLRDDRPDLVTVATPNATHFEISKAYLEAGFNVIAGRELEDDSLTAFRMDGGAVGRLWASGLAIGRTHGLTLQVFGERGGMRWAQEQPNQLYWRLLNAPTQILERGATGLSPEAARASRITVGHPEGMVFAFGNIYRDLSDVIAAHLAGSDPDPLALSLPTAVDGLHSIETISAAAASARGGGTWTNI